MTLDEIIAKYSKSPGDIKLTDFDWNKFDYFQPFFRSSNVWYGLDELQRPEKYDCNSDGWVLWERPKEKVKKWLWATLQGSEIYRDFKEHEIPGYPVKLTWSETEFDT